MVSIYSKNQTLILLSANLYMFFRQDLTEYYDRVKSITNGRYGELKFLAHGTHNHHGMDTAGLDSKYPVNRRWYKEMLETLVEITLKSLENRRPGSLFYAKSPWAFGVGDVRDPVLLDPELRVLQAKENSGKVIATIIQWAMHPEVTLGFKPKVDPSDCERLRQPNCSAQGKYFSGDFIDPLENTIKRAFGGEVLYFSGFIGNQVGPNGQRVWEVSQQFPIIGDGSIIPNGAPILRERNFRKAFLIGRELGYAVERALKNSKLIQSRIFNYKSQDFFLRITNVKFRIGTVVSERMMGYSKREAYICSDPQNPTNTTCLSDQFRSNSNNELKVPMREGEFIKSLAIYVDFGPFKILTAPGEVPPESYTGLPLDFNTNITKYYRNPQNHATGSQYQLTGNIREIMNCSHHSCMVIGLGNDQLGYFVPLNDIRMKCILNQTICKSLPLTYPDSMSGRECKWILENLKEAERKYGVAFQPIYFICRYGSLNIATNHYEETNGASWDLERIYIETVKKLLK